MHTGKVEASWRCCYKSYTLGVYHMSGHSLLVRTKVFMYPLCKGGMRMGVPGEGEQRCDPCVPMCVFPVAPCSCPSCDLATCIQPA